jgi:hypothetical protein
MSSRLEIIRLLLICFIVLVLVYFFPHTKGNFWHFTYFQIKNHRARKWKCHMICIWKFYFLLRWFWSILGICQVNLLPWLGFKKFINLVVSCRFWHILCSFSGFGGFPLPLYLSNLCNPLVIASFFWMNFGNCFLPLIILLCLLMLLQFCSVYV